MKILSSISIFLFLPLYYRDTKTVYIDRGDLLINKKLEKISKSFFIARVVSLPFPILSKVDDTKIAWEILDIVLRLNETINIGCHFLGFNNLYAFSIRDLFPIIDYFAKNLISEELTKFEKNTKLIAYYKGDRSHREAQT